MFEGGVGNELALTAYVLGALLDSKGEKELNDDVAIIKARDYLEKNVHNATNSYTIALMAYTLSRFESDFAQILLQKLNDRAHIQQSLKYWTAEKESQAWMLSISLWVLMSYG